MDATTVVLKLNQQQIELLDRTIACGAAADRETLIKRALREFAAQHDARRIPDRACSEPGP